MSHNPSQQLIDKKRIAFTIPNFKRFGELLHDRLHTIVFHLEEIESRFLLITNLFDRNPDRIEEAIDAGLNDTEALVYAGTEIQRKILEKKGPPKPVENDEEAIKAWNAARDQDWQGLSKSLLIREEGSKTVEFFDKFREGQLGLDDIKVEKLSDYFADIDSDFKRYEYPIISDYFDIDKTYYIGIPLMGMGLFQGIVWILFPEEEIQGFKNPKRTKRLIKLFQMEYDELVLSWDIFGTNMNRKSVVDKAIEEIKSNNPIQEECNIKKYYEISNYYQSERIRQSNAVPDKLNEQYIKTATITILLDSFSHNISAHSLTALSWWFREAADYFNEESKSVIEEFNRDNNPIIRYLKQNEKGKLADELQRFFKFLLEKGAFWSGITRQTNFPGKVNNLYEILWSDFANNSLYLGTIANTEEVRKIFINLTIYEEEIQLENERFKNRKKIKKTPDGRLLDGTFAIVNLDDFETPTHNSRTRFLAEGEMYQDFKSHLQNFKAFFPGGIIGKHAFFTLLENEIRNVKHFKGKVLEDIQRNGLILNISIHERPVDSTLDIPTDQYGLLKIGVWLKHNVDLSSEMLIRRIGGLDANIITDETFQPRLAGNQQDKICASMLMTNSFDKVQVRDSPIGEIYYPWIKTAGYTIREEKDSFIEFEVSQRKYKDAIEEESFNADFSSEEGVGYLKKYFHLWKGAEIITIAPDYKPSQEVIENKARFQFINLEQPDDLLKNQLKAGDGAIRVISGIGKDDHLPAAYKRWLPVWLKATKNSTDTVVDFIEGDTPVGRILFEKESISFQSYEDIKNINKIQFNAYKAIPNRIEIAIEHGGRISNTPDKLNYRSHGELISRFCKGLPMSKVSHMADEEVYELLEALATKICVFDRRMYSRLYDDGPSATNVKNNRSDKKRKLKKDRIHLYQKNLLLDFRIEQQSDWNEVQKQGFLNFHFLIIHLSFIESMKMKRDATKLYREETIIDFIRDEILQGVPPEQVPDNFILVITTGRGRMAWWDKIKSDHDYARFTTFRPIESLLRTVEDALLMPDDINLKFNLTKLLLGS